MCQGKSSKVGILKNDLKLFEPSPKGFLGEPYGKSQLSYANVKWASLDSGKNEIFLNDCSWLSADLENNNICNRFIIKNRFYFHFLSVIFSERLFMTSIS